LLEIVALQALAGPKSTAKTQLAEIPCTELIVMKTLLEDLSLVSKWDYLLADLRKFEILAAWCPEHELVQCCPFANAATRWKQFSAKTFLSGAKILAADEGLYKKIPSPAVKYLVAAYAMVLQNLNSQAVVADPEKWNQLVGDLLMEAAVARLSVSPPPEPLGKEHIAELFAASKDLVKVVFKLFGIVARRLEADEASCMGHLARKHKVILAAEVEAAKAAATAEEESTKAVAVVGAGGVVEGAAVAESVGASTAVDAEGRGGKFEGTLTARSHNECVVLATAEFSRTPFWICVFVSNLAIV
jgi:hypothetical protein